MRRNALQTAVAGGNNINIVHGLFAVLLEEVVAGRLKYVHGPDVACSPLLH